MLTDLLASPLTHSSGWTSLIQPLPLRSLMKLLSPKSALMLCFQTFIPPRLLAVADITLSSPFKPLLLQLSLVLD